MVTACAADFKKIDRLLIASKRMQSKATPGVGKLQTG